MKSKEVSQKSISMIEDAVASYLGSRPWSVDWGIPIPEGEKSYQSALVLGNYFQRIFQVQFWPEAPFELYCVSPSVKKVLVEVFHYDSDLVGCLSRYDLFPASLSPEDFHFTPTTNFFYAGRLSPQKNIEFLILVFFYLQFLYSADITLTLIGDFDNEYHKDFLGFDFVDYQMKIEQLIEGLPWSGEKPKLIHGKNEREWGDVIPPRGLYFSCSNLISEDFCVTVAQLQQAGKPLLLPYWGGLQDVQGDNVRFFHPEAIAHSHLNLKLINQKARALAQQLSTQTFYPCSPESFRSFRPVEKIDRQYLIKKSEENKRRWGTSLELVEQERLPDYIKTEEGQKLFRACRKAFGPIGG